MRVLHLGCGRKGHELPIDVPADAEIISVDADPELKPDVLCVLGVLPLPVESDSVDLAIAWHVLEHIGTQGDTTEWFGFWEDLYRVLKPGGRLLFEAPMWDSVWAWGDPTHVRALSPQALGFFAQENYRLPGSSISPYRVRCDFKPAAPYHTVYADQYSCNFQGVLEAIKPLKPWWEDK